MAKCTKFYEKQQIVSNSLFVAHFDVRFAYLAKNTEGESEIEAGKYICKHDGPFFAIWDWFLL